jgi:cell division protein ZapD
MNNLFFYEHPLTERMRLFLRFEFLWKQIKYHSELDQEYSHRAVISFLVELLELLERGDIKTEVHKELDLKLTILNHVLTNPAADKKTTSGLINKVNIQKNNINEIDTSFMSALKNSELLTNIRHRNAVPGGLLSFDLPELHNWLRFPIEMKERRLSHWLKKLEIIASSISFILWLNREWIDLRSASAEEGVYNYQMDHQTSVNMIRIGIPSSDYYFPEISAGRHRFIIRFCKTDEEDKPVQLTGSVNFLIGVI